MECLQRADDVLYSPKICINVSLLSGLCKHCTSYLANAARLKATAEDSVELLAARTDSADTLALKTELLCAHETVRDFGRLEESVT